MIDYSKRRIGSKMIVGGSPKRFDQQWTQDEMDSMLTAWDGEDRKITINKGAAYFPKLKTGKTADSIVYDEASEVEVEEVSKFRELFI